MTPPPLSPRIQGYGARRLSIMVVEDCRMSRKMFHLIFGDDHYVTMAAGVEDGWKLYLEKTPNMVFIDIGLPDGSGNDLAQRIKAHNPAVYIVMATASRKIDDKVAAVRNHVDGYIGKPLRKKELGAYVDRYLLAHAATRAQATRSS